MEWLISVTRSSLPSTRDGGFDCVTSAMKRGDGSGRVLSFQRKNIAKTARLRGVRIEETLAVEMLRKPWVARALLHESSFYSRLALSYSRSHG